MEFEDHDEHEEEEEDEEEEEMGLPPSYDSLPNSSRVKMIVGSSAAEQSTTPVAAAAASGGLVPSTGHLVPSAGTTTTAMNSRYRECLKNHAVGIGLHAVDGCGEFMAAGAEGTLDGLKCAACNCHRNFHRKEIATGATAADPIPASIFHGGHGHNQVPQFAPYYRSPAGYLHVGPPHPRPLALPSTSGGGQSREDQEDVLNSSGGGGGGGGDGSSRKRFRTKFTPEQKERMLGLAERLGWRIQKHDEAVVQQFCNETGVRRQVLKVWMHNNKHTLGKKP